MTDAEPVRVTLRRSGGMLPTDDLEVAVSTDELDERSRAVLAEHLARAQVEQLAERSPLEGRGADMYSYDLTVERGGRSRHVEVAQTALPESLRPLVRWLEQRAGPRPA